MNTIEQKETRYAMILRSSAQIYANYGFNKQDVQASKLAVLWAAFEQEAMAQGLTQWRGIQLGDDHEN
jgi:hypothetical protein